MRKFKEYLDFKGKTVEKPIIDKNGDTSPEPSKTPTAAVNKGKNWETSPAVSGKPMNYSTSTEGMKQQKGERGFADEGDKKLLYKPKISDNPPKEGGEKKSTWPKTKTEAFIEETKDMNAAQFAAFMAEKQKGNITLVKKLDEACIPTLIWEFKHQGKFGKLLEEIFQHAETFNYLASILADEFTAKKLVRALGEVTDAPADETIVTKADLKPKKAKQPKSIQGEKIAGEEGAGVVMTRKAEHKLIEALLNNEQTIKHIKEMLK